MRSETVCKQVPAGSRQMLCSIVECQFADNIIIINVVVAVIVVVKSEADQFASSEKELMKSTKLFFPSCFA